MYTDDHEPLPHPEPGPGEATHRYAGVDLKLPFVSPYGKQGAPSIVPSQLPNIPPVPPNAPKPKLS